MTKVFRKALTLVLSLMLLISLFCMTALAASVGASVSSSSVTVGDSVTVSFSVGPGITAHRLSVSYNSSVLQFSGSSGSESFFANGGDGQIVVVQSFNSPTDGTLTGSITFKAIAAGSATVSLSGSASNAAEESVSVSGSSVSITVSNPPTASSDATLSAMSISPGSLSPSFSSNTTSYTATVSASTTQLNVYATTSDENADISVSNRNLSVGSNTVKVTVTAEDGTTKVYTITVTRPAGTTGGGSSGGSTGGNTSGGSTTDNTPETDVPEAPTEAYIALEDGTILEVAETIDEEKVPAGFALTETTIDGFTVDAIKYSENSDPAVWLIGDDNAPEGFYFINEEGLGYPMITLSQPEEGIILTDITDYDAPDGYILGKFNIGETEYDAFIKDDGKDPDHCLIYGINATGETILYCYEPTEGTFQKYGIASFVEVKEVEVEVVKEVEVEVIKEVEVPAEPEELTLATLLKDKLIFWSLIGIGVVILVLIALCIMLAIMYSRKSKACRLMASKRSFNTEPLPTIEE